MTKEAKWPEHTVHCGNCCDFMKDMQGGSVNLVMSSPPYNLGKEYEIKKEIKDYLEFQTKIIKELIRITSNDGSICWQVGNYVHNGEIIPLDCLFFEIFSNEGLKLRNRIVWHFESGLHCSKRFSGRYEMLLWFTKSDKYKFDLDSVRIPQKYPGKKKFGKKNDKEGKYSSNPMGKNPSDFWIVDEKNWPIKEEWNNAVWNIPNVKSNHVEKSSIHPCSYPIELVERVVLALTEKGDTVFDPFVGIGSTVVASLIHGRKGIGCDTKKEYCEEAEKRIQQLKDGKLRHRALGTHIYEPYGKLTKRPDIWNQDQLGTL